MRHLHYKYPSPAVYATHDQSEGLTTADLVAVMNAGRIEQAGSPEEIYDRPRSEFVARFIGSSNGIKGRALDESHLRFGESVLRCTGGQLPAGSRGGLPLPQPLNLILAGRPPP